MFSTYLIEKIKGEIDELEMELDYIHNSSSISPINKVNKVIKLLENITKKKSILELYINYIIKSKETENGIDNK